MSAPLLFSPLTQIFPQNKPIFLGKGTPGAEVTICQSNTAAVLAKTIADTNGSWLVQSSVELPVGKYSVSAYHSGANEYATNVPFMVEDNSQSSVPVVTPPEIPGTPGGPSTLPYGSNPIVTRPAANTTLTTRRPRLEGRAAANAIVYAYSPGYGTLYGHSNADINGNWYLDLEQDLVSAADGTATVILAQLNNGAWVSNWTNVSYSVNNTGAASGALTLDTPPTNSTINTLRPVLRGKAAANATVKIYQKGGIPYFGDVQADANGDWSLQLAQDLVAGANNQVVLALTQDNGVNYIDFTLYANVTPNNTALPYGSNPIVTRPAANTTLTTRRPRL
ncbi:hypothetical protein, partial [uncultured Pseudomonas sp.]|uniref:hypothetical protein n=1 Tax=uncultured Pseudomonas sp. TaxID=114707 RepID=UPI0025E4E976